MLHGAAQKTAAERAEGHEADAQIAAYGQHRLLRFARPQRVFALQRRDRMRRVRAPDALRSSLREPQESDFAVAHEIGHRANGVLDGHGRIDPVQIVQVDGLDSETGEARVATRPHALRTRIHVGRGAARGVGNQTELAGEDDPVPAVANRSTDQLFVRPFPVDVCRVDERHAQIEGPVNGSNRLLIVRGAVTLRHPHAPQAHGRHRQAAHSQLTKLHSDVRLPH